MSLKNKKPESSERENETRNIQAVLMIEVMGTPPKHLTDTLEMLIKNIDAETGVKVKGKNLKEPTLMKDQKQFYTAFAEVEVEVEEILYLAILLFKYMPAHVEIIKPELIALTNFGWNDIFNELTRRLHGYDEVARILQFQNAQLQKNLQEVLSPEKPRKKSVKKKTKKASGKKVKKKTAKKK